MEVFVDLFEFSEKGFFCETKLATITANLKLGVFDRRCLTKLSIWEKSENFLMILPLFFEHFIRVCVFRSFSFFFSVPFYFNVLPTYFFPLLLLAHFIFAISRICELLNCARCDPCVWVCTHIAHSFWFFFCLLKCALEGSLIFFWLLQPKFHKEAKIKFLLITWMHMRGKRRLFVNWKPCSWQDFRLKIFVRHLCYNLQEM